MNIQQLMFFAYTSEICEDTFDETLTNYINNKGTIIRFDNCFEDDKTRNAFFTVIVRSVSLSDQIYKGYLKQFNLFYPMFSIKGLPQNKMKILDELGKVKMNVENLMFIREHYVDYLPTFAAKHISEYIDLMPDHYIHDEAIELLNSEISDKNKIALLELDKTPVSIKQKYWSDAVTFHVLLNNYDANDLSYLLEAYSSFGKQTQIAVFKIATNQIKIVLSTLPDVDRQLLSALIISDDVDLEDKKDNIQINSTQSQR